MYSHNSWGDAEDYEFTEEGVVFMKNLLKKYLKSQEKNYFSKEAMIKFVEWIIEKYISYNDVYITKVDYYYSEAELKLLKHYSTEELLELWKEQQPKVFYYDSK